jgi:elongation factor P--(R)-beta-lysine ligase
MDRQQFLKNWSQFPSAPSSCRSLVRFDKKPGWVGGQLGFSSVQDWEGGQFFLFSNQTGSLKLRWDFPFLFAKSEKDPGNPLANSSLSSLFHFGDHLAAELDKPNPDGTWSVKRLMLLAPSSKAEKVSYRSDWPRFLTLVREFFVVKGFQEVPTPTLVTCPGLEPALEPFSTSLKIGSRSQTLHLPTSPEIHLKKALCAGLTDIFEIKTCFRNGEISEAHQPEFHMLEWYRAYANLDLVIEDLNALVKKFGAPEVSVTTFRELFHSRLGFDLTPRTSREQLFSWCEKLALHPSFDDTAADLFHRLWIDKIESSLEGPVVVRDFPADQAALARIKEDGWADRFEFFWKGFEIANAFHEVNDPEEQIERWEIEKMERRRLGRTELTGDEELISLMRSKGLPPTGGIALGLERLFMAANNIPDIKTLALFPYK